MKILLLAKLAALQRCSDLSFHVLSERSLSNKNNLIKESAKDHMCVSDKKSIKYWLHYTVWSE